MKLRFSLLVMLSLTTTSVFCQLQPICASSQSPAPCVVNTTGGNRFVCPGSPVGSTYFVNFSTGSDTTPTFLDGGTSGGNWITTPGCYRLQFSVGTCEYIMNVEIMRTSFTVGTLTSNKAGNTICSGETGTQITVNETAPVPTLRYIRKWQRSSDSQFLTGVEDLASSAATLPSNFIDATVSKYYRPVFSTAPEAAVSCAFTTSPAPILITVNSVAAPPVPTGYDPNACGIQTLTKGSANYYWQTAVDGTTTTGVFATSNTWSSQNTNTSQTYFLRALNGNCWSATTTQTLAFKRVPTDPSLAGSITDNSATATCGPVTVTVGNYPPLSADETWNWQANTPGTTINPITTSNFQFDVNVSGANTYYVRAVDDISGCWSVGYLSKSVTVNPRPNAPPIPTGYVSGACGSQTLTKGDPTYFWQTSASGTDNTSGPAISNTWTSVNSNSDQTYYLRARAANGCWSLLSTTETLTFKKIPDSPTLAGAITPDNAPCGPQVLTVSGYPATGAGADTWHWQGTNGGPSPTVGSPIGTPPSLQNAFQVTTSGTYYVRALGANGCWNNTQLLSRTVTINDRPATPTEPTGYVVGGCGIQTLTKASATFFWQTSAAGQDNTSGFAISNTWQSSNADGTQNYFLRARAANGCWSLDSYNGSVVVKRKPGTPTPTLTPAANPSCGPTTITVTGTLPVNGDTWHWQGLTPGTTINVISYPANQVFSVSTTGTYHVRALYNGCWSDATAQRAVTINAIPPPPATPTITSTTCTPKTLKALGAPTTGWYWQDQNSAGQSTVLNATTDYIASSPGTYYLGNRSAQGCWSYSSRDVTIDLNLPAPTAGDVIVCGPGAQTLSASTPGEFADFRWYLTAGATTPWRTGQSVQSEVLANGDEKHYWVTYYKTNFCESAREEVVVTSKPQPATPSPFGLTICDWQIIKLTATPPPAGSLQWYDPAGTLLGSGLTYRGPVLPSGAYAYSYKSVGSNGCISAASATISVTVTDNCEDNLNWTEKTSYSDGITTTSKTKTYYDGKGKLLQRQTLNLSANQVFSSQSVTDRLERKALESLPAPINRSTFRYKSRFILNSAGQPYSYLDFDLPVNIYAPAPVGNQTIGTLGWYYSANNTMEQFVPSTTIPYSRIEYYEDGSGAVKRAASVGDAMRLGTGHERASGTFQLANGLQNELSDYLTKRAIALPGNSQPTNLALNALVSVNRDQNGRMTVTISDKSGNTLMSATPGTRAFNCSTSSTKSISFYLLTPQIVSVSGGTLASVQDMLSGQSVNIASTLQPGFYKATVATGTVTLSYVENFGNISYSFFDTSGKLRVSISPNGYEQWMAGVAFSNIDKETYEYDFRGLIVATTKPDAGRTEFVYRKDGKVRFSQDARQRALNRFSYTNYDKIGRAVESGEYIGTGVVFKQPSMTALLELTDAQITWAATDKQDWMRSYYDLPAGVALPAGRIQTFVRGVISWSESKTSKTYFSYDEQGRLKWTWRKPEPITLAGGQVISLDKSFLSEYDYDLNGNVTRFATLAVDAGGNILNLDKFYHHYEYDADGRLTRAYTSLDGASQKKLRATYQYYLHGPLKRVELGDALQGIDYVYNINGWLVSINNPDTRPLKDPGQDGEAGSPHANFKKDAFGMIIDYYEDSLGGLFQASIPGILNPNLFHRIPGEMDQRKLMASNSGFQDLEQSLQQLKELAKGGE